MHGTHFWSWGCNRGTLAGLTRDQCYSFETSNSDHDHFPQEFRERMLVQTLERLWNWLQRGAAEYGNHYDLSDPSVYFATLDHEDERQELAALLNTVLFGNLLIPRPAPGDTTKRVAPPSEDQIRQTILVHRFVAELLPKISNKISEIPRLKGHKHFLQRSVVHFAKQFSEFFTGARKLEDPDYDHSAGALFENIMQDLLRLHGALTDKVWLKLINEQRCTPLEAGELGADVPNAPWTQECPTFQPKFVDKERWAEILAGRDPVDYAPAKPFSFSVHPFPSTALKEEEVQSFAKLHETTAFLHGRIKRPL